MKSFSFGRSSVERAFYRRVWLAMLLSLGLSSPVLAGKPYRPQDQGEVLETLPRGFFSGLDELAELRTGLTNDPRNVELASTVATRYLEMGGSNADPRFFGYARAAIGPWWDDAEAPIPILRIRAKLKEIDHLHDEAVADLQSLLRLQPQDAQAWIELANIYRLQGRYSDALETGERLTEFAGSAPAILCRAPILAVTGQADEAYRLLALALPYAKEKWPGSVQWLLTMLADTARSMGRNEDAELHFREGLDRNPSDRYQIRSYADFLLDQGRADEALELTQDHANDNGILLRAAIAARIADEGALASDLERQLRTRFAEIRLRGSQPHGRYEARYLLEIQGNPTQALAVALANWKKQKEVRDTRNVLEAAIAAMDTEAAQPVLDFLARHGTKDVTLRRLADQLESIR